MTDTDASRLNGLGHYREAERLMNVAAGHEAEQAAVILAEAQVHATLALAAAVGRPQVISYSSGEWSPR